MSDYLIHIEDMSGNPISFPCYVRVKKIEPKSATFGFALSILILLTTAQSVTTSNDAFAQPITPSGATPFEQLAQGQQGQSQQQPTGIDDPNIELLSARFIDDQFGGEIVGEIMNNGTASAQFVEALATLRDSVGTVIGTSFGFADPHQVAAKDSAPFNILLTSETVQDQAATYDLTLKWQDMDSNEFSKDVLSNQPFEYGIASTGGGGGTSGGGGDDNMEICYTIEIDPPLGSNETLPIPVPVPPNIPPCPDQPNPKPPAPNSTIPGPDERCLFDPSLPHCTPSPGEDCPEGFGTNEDGQCFPLGGCPDGYHSNEDDETGTCYPDSEPCPEGQVRSDEGNYCVVPEEPDPISCPAVFPPPPGCPGLEDLEPEQQCEIDPSLPDCIENEDQQIDNSEESAELEPAPPEEDLGDESGNNEGGDGGNNEGGDGGNNEGGDGGNNEGGGDDSDDDE